MMTQAKIEARRKDPLSASEQQLANEFQKVQKSTTHKAIALEMKDRVNEAVELYKQGAAHGCTIAMCTLGRIFIHGQGIPANQEMGFHWFQKCVNHGPCPASALACGYDAAYDSGTGSLGQAYQHGWGVTKDLAKAHTCLQQAAESGDGLEQNNYGSFLCQQGDFETGVKWYRKSALASYPLGMTNLAAALRLGRGCSKSEKEAEKWLMKANNAGDASACILLARMRCEQNQAGEIIAILWERALNLQQKYSDSGTVNNSTAIQAFQSLVAEQEKLDQALSLEELQKAWMSLNFDTISSVINSPDAAQSEQEAQRIFLLKLVRHHRSLTLIEQRAIAVVSRASSGEAALLLGLFLKDRGCQQLAIKVFAKGAALADSDAACEAGELLMVAGPLKDLPRASKYLCQAMTSRLNNKRAATLLQALRVDLEQNLGLGPSESELAEVLRKNVVISHIQRFQLQYTKSMKSGRLIGESPMHRAELLEEYVLENPQSYTGRGMLHSSKFHSKSILLAFQGDLDRAVNMLAMAYLFDTKGVQRTYILDSDNGMPSHTEQQDKLVLAVARNRYAKNPGDVCAAIILMFAILPGDDSDLK